MTSVLLKWGYVDVETPEEDLQKGRHVHMKTAIFSQKERHGTTLPSQPSEGTSLNHYDLGLIATRVVS